MTVVEKILKPQVVERSSLRGRQLTPERVKKDKEGNGQIPSMVLQTYEKTVSGLERYLTPKMKELITKEVLRPTSWNIKNLKRAKWVMKNNIVRKGSSVLFNIKDVNQLIAGASKSPGNFLILLSYCSKPKNCPSNRFSEECQPQSLSNVCNNCPFKEIRLKAVKIGCEFYIDYDTKKMLKKYLLPTFRKFKEAGEYKPMIVVSCPLGVNKFLETAIIIGFKGIGYYLTEGICRTMGHYDKSDKGEKSEVTNLGQGNWQEINYILDEIIKRIKK